MYYKIIDGKTVYNECKALKINNAWVSNPTIEMIHADGWLEYIQPQPEPYVPTYEEKVVALIREKYDENQEYEVLREMLAYPMDAEKKAAFDEYNAYVEWCKEYAKEPQDDGEGEPVENNEPEEE